MNPASARRWRTRPIALLAVLATLIGLLSACSSDRHDVAANSTASMSMAPASAVAAIGRTTSQSALYEAMQNLWSQHMEWTYAAITAFATGSPAFADTAARLLQNQVDIGNAIKPYYGDAAGEALAALLKTHILDVVAVLKGAKSGDKAAYTSAANDTYANANAIADFLSNANPKYWSDTDMRQMMKEHIDQTVVYASDQLGGKYADSIIAYGLAETHMIAMADMLSAGLTAAFPTKFTS